MSRAAVGLCAAIALQALIAPVPQGASGPTEDGNRANHFNYQPTPSEVDPLERKAGILPSDREQDSTDRSLENTDRQLLQQEGASTSSVPIFTPQ